MKTPYLKKQGNKTLLYVKEKPFIMIAGEVHNSSSSSLSYMEDVWEKAMELGLNTLLLPISWELIEPVQGEFDFSLVKGLIDQARERKMKISFLWFGSWKNAQCYYVPSWVKTDLLRYKRAEVIKGEKFTRNKDFYGMPYTTMSYLCEETKQADAYAFSRLMAFIRDYDSADQTVITVQVENETGIMGAAREHSDEADQFFNDMVPQKFADYMYANIDKMQSDIKEEMKKGKRRGNWSEVFGSVAEEIFSAFFVSGYVNEVAQKGKTEYNIPMSANCWLNKEGEHPGSYPSGGPIDRVKEVWKFCAPSIDILAPDIYVPNFTQVCDAYTEEDNPLYIPECATHSYAASRLMLCVGHYQGLCYSPFGFEDMGKPFDGAMTFLFGADVTDPALQNPQDVTEYGQVSKYLQQLMPVITEKYGTSLLQASCKEKEKAACFEFEQYKISAVFESPLMTANNGGCLVVQEESDTFYILVNKAMILFESNQKSKQCLDILELEEGEFVNGEWIRNRRLNGDEAVLTSYNAPTLLKVRLFAYE